MPNRDKTGPDGEGSRTGGQRGSCIGTQVGSRPRDGRGQGQGQGQGTGIRRRRRR